MSTDLSAYIEEGKALDPDARAIVARQLQQVDEPDQADIDAAWDEAIDRRATEILTGRATSVSGQETLRMARAKLAARQQ